MTLRPPAGLPNVFASKHQSMKTGDDMTSLIADQSNRRNEKTNQASWNNQDCLNSSGILPLEEFFLPINP